MSGRRAVTAGLMDIDLLLAALEGMDGEQLLKFILEHDPPARGFAWTKLMDRGWAGCTVVDDACNVTLTVQLLRQHLTTTDSVENVTRRGHRLHTVANTRFDSLEDAEHHGPAKAFGPGR